MKMAQEQLVLNIMKEIVGDKSLSDIKLELYKITGNYIVPHEGLNITSLALVNMYKLIKDYNINNIIYSLDLLTKIPKNTVKFTVKNQTKRLKKVTFYKLNIYTSKNIFKSEYIGCKQYIKIKKPWTVTEIDTSNTIIKNHKQCFYIHTLFGKNILLPSNELKITIGTYDEVFTIFSLENGIDFVHEEELLYKLMSYIINKCIEKSIQIEDIRLETSSKELNNIILDELLKLASNILNGLLQAINKKDSKILEVQM